MTLAEEAANDVLVSIWLRHKDIEIHVPLKAYLFKAVRMYCAYRLRGMKRHECITDLPEDLNMGLVYDLSTLERKELGQLILKAIACISSPSGRKAFEMQYIEGMPQKAIAGELNLSIDAVKKQISRALKEVRAYLKKYL